MMGRPRAASVLPLVTAYAEVTHVNRLLPSVQIKPPLEFVHDHFPAFFHGLQALLSRPQVGQTHVATACLLSATSAYQVRDYPYGEW
jgi:hypothetical protein